jgi:DNA-binding CsgD family transcriptional regulator
MVTNGTIACGRTGSLALSERRDAPTIARMSRTISRRAPPRMDTPAWFADAGAVVQSIGTEFFHRELIRLLEVSIPSDAVWIIRYSGEAPPDVVYTHNVTERARQVYLEECGGIDPFSMRWRTRREGGVATLAALRDDSVEYLLYARLFLPAAGVMDELGVFFPVAGQNCFGFFLEREQGRFTAAEVRRAELMYPALASLYRAHLGWLFNELRYADKPEASGLINRPTLIEDRSGEKVYSNAAWDEIAERNPSVLVSPELAGPEPGQIELGGLLVKAEPLGADFPLAPGGRMIVAERRPGAAASERASSLANVFQIFTPRERDILDLVMDGRCTAEIAERLGIGAGSVKNCKMRIYRKADVATERALVTKFLPLYEPR